MRRVFFQSTLPLLIEYCELFDSLPFPCAQVDGFDSPRRQSYLEIARGGRGAMALDHARAAQKADKFLRERVLGTNIDPIRFFCLGMPPTSICGNCSRVSIILTEYSVSVINRHNHSVPGETKAVDEHQGSSSSSDEEEAGAEDAVKDGVEKRPQWSLPDIEPIPNLEADPAA